jgi:hypothetical protein
VSPFAGTITGSLLATQITSTDLIDLTDLTFVSGGQTKETSEVYNAGTNTTAVTFTDGTKSVTLTFSGDYSAAKWDLVNDGSGGTLVNLHLNADHWLNTSGGNWNDTVNAGTNWSAGIPATTGTTDVFLDASGSYTVTTSANVDINSLEVNSGVTLSAGVGFTFKVEGATTNSGTIEAGPFSSNKTATVDLVGNVTGTGSLDIANKATFEIGGVVSSGQTVFFEAGQGTLILDNSLNFNGAISDNQLNTTTQIGHNDLIDLKDLTYDNNNKPILSFNSITDILTVNDQHGHIATIHFVNVTSTPTFSAQNDGTGHVQIVDPPPPAIIDSGGTFEITAASTQDIIFSNNSGTTGNLVLDDSVDYTGVISGFSGDGTVANSDAIDLKDVNFAQLTQETFTENSAGTGGTLTVSDGTHTANIDLVGNFNIANFKFLSDPTGGTMVIDPPVVASQNGPGSVTHEVEHDPDPTGGNGPYADLSIPQPGTIQSVLTNFVNQFESANKLELDNLLAAHGNEVQQLQELVHGATNGHNPPVNVNQLQELAQDLANGHNPLVNSGEEIHVTPVDPYHGFIIHT